MSFQHSYCQCETCKRQERQAFIDEALISLMASQRNSVEGWALSPADLAECAMLDARAAWEAREAERQRCKEGGSDG